MRGCTAAAAFALCLASVAQAVAAEGFFLGEDIARSCKSEKDLVAVYVAGVADAYAMLGAAPKFCFAADGTTALELADVVCKAIGGDAEVPHTPASAVVVKMLLKAFPCPPAS